MNILTDVFPTSIEIDGKDYEINADFRTCLDIIMAFEDEELIDREKQTILLLRLYKTIPENVVAAIEKGVDFLNCGEPSETGADDQPRTYNFQKDGKYIYSAMRQAYQVDLEIADLHWWKFCYMFTDLGENCFFNRLVYLRNRKNEGKLTEEEAKYCNQISDILELDGISGEGEEIDEFMRLLRQNN